MLGVAQLMDTGLNPAGAAAESSCGRKTRGGRSELTGGHEKMQTLIPQVRMGPRHCVPNRRQGGCYSWSQSLLTEWLWKEPTLWVRDLGHGRRTCAWFDALLAPS